MRPPGLPSPGTLQGAQARPPRLGGPLVPAGFDPLLGQAQIPVCHFVKRGIAVSQVAGDMGSACWWHLPWQRKLASFLWLF